MKAVLGFFKNKWVIQFIGIALLGVLIWFAGPLVAIAGKAVLEPALVRGLTIAAIVVVWVVFRLLMQIRSSRKDQQLMADLAVAAPAKSAEQEASEEEVALLRKTFEEALGILRETRSKGKRGRQFLYELPWYVIIGAPGSGKTTALVNSGLQFPLAERFGKNPIKGISGTRNCDWWFTDEAVLLDTAGRYTTQDSHQAVDAAAWQGFLGLIKKHRAERPLNGVLVAMSVSDLLQQTEEERRLNAKAVRRRIGELYQSLGVRFPIYMLFTKCDLIAGFTDFFADLNQEERNQVLGETFPLADPKALRDFLDEFDAAYDELLKRLEGRTLTRIHDERDIQRRATVLEFPQQVALLKPALMSFLRETFGVTRFETPSLLRGIYFTSGTQEGTPIDRVMGILAQAFRLSRQSAPVYSGQGKSFFLNRLLREVVFTEADLAGVDPVLERRRRLAEVGLYAGAALFAAAMAALWALSYGRNQWALARVGEQIDRYNAVASVGTDWASSLEALLPRMRALREARDIYETGGWSMHLGLYQGNKIGTALDGVYEKLLQDSLLPLVKTRLEQRMAGSDAANPEVLYELLRVYLSLGEPKRLEEPESRDAAETLIRADWAGQFATDPSALAELSVHLDALLRLPPEAIALNNDMVSGVRARLNEVPRIVQAYKHFKNDKLRDHAHDIRLGAVLGKSGNQVFVAANAPNVADVTVPGFFTAKGYQEYFLKAGFKVLQEGLRQDWVLGDERSFDTAEMENMRRDFEKLYFADYQKTWSELVANVRLRGGGALNQTAELLDTLSKKDSPLRAFLELIEKNTTLSRVTDAVAAAIAAQLGIKPEAGAPDTRTQKLLDEAKAAAGLGDAAQDPVRQLERQFEPLNRLVRKTGDQPAPLDDTLAGLKDLHVLALQAASGGGAALKAAGGAAAGGGGAPAEAARKLKDLPEPLQSQLSGLASAVGKQTSVGAKAQLNAMLQTNVAVPCRAAFAGRYPFARNSAQDATLADFTKFFSPNGIIDGFFQANLKDLVDTSRGEWRQLPGSSKSLSLSQGTIAQFQTAAKIRDAFFGAGAPTLAVRFDLRPLSLDSGVARFSLNIEGQETTNEHGPEVVASFQWPGTAPNKGVRMDFRTLDGREVSSPIKQGPWALFRFLDEAGLRPTDDPVRFNLTFRIGEYRAGYELRADSVRNPFNLDALRAFRCPEAF